MICLPAKHVVNNSRLPGLLAVNGTPVLHDTHARTHTYMYVCMYVYIQTIYLSMCICLYVCRDSNGKKTLHVFFYKQNEKHVWGQEQCFYQA